MTQLELKSNAVSYDFPLRFKNELTNPIMKKTKLPSSRRYETHCFNNESPELFRLDSMAENKNGYRNPFLDEVITVDHNESYKKMDYDRKQIELIDKIKCNRIYSQNPKILSYIRSEFDVAMQDKRERILKERNTLHEDNRYKLESGKDNDLFERKITQLHTAFSPKMSYKVKRQIDSNTVVPLSTNYKIPETDKKLFTSLICDLESRKSGYLRNLNDYNIKEADNPDKSKELHFTMKDRVAYNLVKDKTDVIKPPPALNHRWDSFHENYVLLQDKQSGFKRKGGLFTEFANKNKCVFDMISHEKKEELAKRKLSTGKAIIGSNAIQPLMNCIGLIEGGGGESKRLLTEITQGTNESKKNDNCNSNQSTGKRNYMTDSNISSKRGKERMTQNNNKSIIHYSITPVENAIKIIEDNNLYKLKNIYLKTPPNNYSSANI